MTPADNDALRSQLFSFSTERIDADLADVDTWPTIDMVRAMNERDSAVPAAVAVAADRIADAVDGITARMRRGGRLIYVGAGTPGRLGILDASECPPTFGTDPELVVGVIAGGDRAVRTAVENSEDDTAAGADDLRALGLTERDAVVGLSASGRTPYVTAALEFARSVGALTVGVASNPGAVLSANADIGIEVVVGPEFVAGSTRLKAGTAQKLVLNMLSTLTMVKLGKTYGTVMVDLQATNAKLRARSERTVMEVTGVDAASASEVLGRAGGSVKLAIAMTLGGLDAPAARAALDRAGGNLRTALERG
ncbi:N-acetylmuramic acid 6-phosphate etherase [Spelaeicoccus albus]|uniref:N-acetylmuramic acid 6-phosphate etherase n=1 Tax=Spelaeicoccus albus TaxID=1280376 RepID=A0A7Z0ABV2_9MICO|nr:N-acetylmuramic acid 6-phosphate etherase [Spelaeicoccus albus]NYI67323.1 N-acetylmuramic acid 6-phosphate etherase [Spelaeicoccus albus]